jgi:hypothetical protein
MFSSPNRFRGAETPAHRQVRVRLAASFTAVKQKLTPFAEFFCGSASHCASSAEPPPALQGHASEPGLRPGRAEPGLFRPRLAAETASPGFRIPGRVSENRRGRPRTRQIRRQTLPSGKKSRSPKAPAVQLVGCPDKLEAFARPVRQLRSAQLLRAG